MIGKGYARTKFAGDPQWREWCEVHLPAQKDFWIIEIDQVKFDSIGNLMIIEKVFDFVVIIPI